MTTFDGFFSVERADVRLECRDYGGEGPTVILLHGLAGTSHEWEATASWLTATHRVIAPDQRGHGRSERFPTSVSTADLVDDVLAIADELKLAPFLLIGQSFGGLVALLTAARRPDLVRALVVAEASPSAARGEDVVNLQSWLDQWPVERPFDAQVVTQTLAVTVGVEYWNEWGSIRAPTLIVRGERGWVSGTEAREMAARLATAEAVAIEGAGHNVHLDAPEEWRRVIEDFLRSIPPQ